MLQVANYELIGHVARIIMIYVDFDMIGISLADVGSLLEIVVSF